MLGLERRPPPSSRPGNLDGGAGGLDLRVLDTSDPGTVHRYAEELPSDKTLFLFASKSGGTLEPRSHLAFFWDRIGRPEQFAVVTEPGTELDQLAIKQNSAGCFAPIPISAGAIPRSPISAMWRAHCSGEGARSRIVTGLPPTPADVGRGCFRWRIVTAPPPADGWRGCCRRASA